MNGISPQFSPLKRDPYWKREWMRLLTLYFFLKKFVNPRILNYLEKTSSYIGIETPPSL